MIFSFRIHPVVFQNKLENELADMGEFILDLKNM